MQSSRLFEPASDPDLQCEAPTQGGLVRVACSRRATHVYGPECEAQTGQLMYLCAWHATLIKTWIDSHLNDPVECPEHGRIGTVKNYLILKEM